MEARKQRSNDGSTDGNNGKGRMPTLRVAAFKVGPDLSSTIKSFPVPVTQQLATGAGNDYQQWPAQSRIYLASTLGTATTQLLKPASYAACRV
ncbi:hypothetical protein E4U55_003397 [Claviceps digitariae]|nr:hypothetical protein E4U55_003397 [Claviceps digitariae]